MKTVDDLYSYCTSNNVRLLPHVDYDFWSIVNDNSLMDSRFDMKYFSFKYFLVRGKSEQDTLVSFKNQITMHLMANETKYKELYRINVVDDDKYSLYNNYDMTETMDRDTTSDIGQQTNSASLDLGEQSNTTTLVAGQQVNTSKDDIGNRNDSNTHSVAPYDSDVTHIESSNALSYGQQHNENETTLGSKTDTTTDSVGSRHDSSSDTKGARHDAGTEDYTLHKVGNIGIQSVSDLLKKHKDFWSRWEFIDYIFSEIAKELLLVD